MQEQLGLKMDSTRAEVEALVIERPGARRPSISTTVEDYRQCGRLSARPS
jgi:hypothetical protein